MSLSAPCLLCHSLGQRFYQDSKRTFYRCGHCQSVFIKKEELPGRRKEKKRYQAHDNDIHDPGYQAFVNPVVNFVEEHYNPNHRGLDYGAGPGPVIAKLLSDKGFSITTYDPFFAPDETVLKQHYDYIICSEVMEHFHTPAEEFELLHQMLNAQGQLVCMTDLYDESIDFAKWYYKNDFTHVFFYHIKALKYIQETFRFRNLEVTGRLIVFTR